MTGPRRVVELPLDLILVPKRLRDVDPLQRGRRSDGALGMAAGTNGRGTRTGRAGQGDCQMVLASRGS